MLKRILTSSWTVTVVATMVGVFAGIYLNNFNNARTLNRYKAQGLEKVKEEINSNEAKVRGQHEELSRSYEVMNFLFSHLNNPSG